MSDTGIGAIHLEPRLVAASLLQRLISVGISGKKNHPNPVNIKNPTTPREQSRKMSTTLREIVRYEKHTELTACVPPRTPGGLLAGL